jgi:hypothetical protein
MNLSARAAATINGKLDVATLQESITLTSRRFWRRASSSSG